MGTDTTRQNGVFILGDNVGWGDIGCYGGMARTPRIDALASQGLRFRNHNVEAQCPPTRSAVLTGRLPIHDPTEEWDLIGKRLDCVWVFAPIARCLGTLAQSAARYPHIQPGQEFSGYA